MTVDYSPIAAPVCKIHGTAKVSSPRNDRPSIAWYCRQCKRDYLLRRRNIGRGLNPVSTVGAKESLARFLQQHWNTDTMHRLADLLEYRPSVGEAS